MSKPSFEDLCKDVRITSQVSDRCIIPGGTGWKVKLTYKGKQLTSVFSLGSAHNREPVATEVIKCLIIDGESVEGETFENWASNFGYNENNESRKIYLACQKEGKKIKKFLGDEYEAFKEASREY